MTHSAIAHPTHLARPLALARSMEVAWVHTVTRITPKADREDERRERLHILDLEISERRGLERDTAIAADLVRRLLLGLPLDVVHAATGWRPCHNCVIRRALRAG